MKFNAKQIKGTGTEHDGKWGVATRGGFFRSSITESREAAEADAAMRSAQWHIEQAKECLAKVGGTEPRQRLVHVGHDAQDVIDMVTDWMRSNDPDFRESDASGWLA